MQTAPRPTPSHQCQVPISNSCKGGSANEIANCAMLWSLETRVLLDGTSRSTLMSAVIDRSSRSEETLPCSWIRCTVPISGGQSCLRSARYGLRGVCIGEASNPGPPQVRPRFSEDGVENVLSSLELELTMLDSDEEPLVRSVDGRYVVPRIHDTPPPTVPASFRDLEAIKRHPRSVVSSVLYQSTVMDSTHAVQVENCGQS